MTIEQPYPSLLAFVRTHGLKTLPKPSDWALLQECPTGNVNALPGVRGRAIASNGIMLAIQTSNAIIFGHRDWFVPDEDTKENKPGGRSRRSKQPIFEYE